MNNIILIIVSFLLFPMIIFAEPDANIRYLMNTNASLLDIGIYKLETKLQNLTLKNVKEYELDAKEGIEKSVQLSTYVSYDWKNNKIVILSHPKGYGLDTFIAAGLEESKNICKKIQTVLHYETLSPLLFGNFFSHEGYKEKGKPENLETAIYDLLQFKSEIKYRDKDDPLTGKAPTLKCTAALAKNSDIYYSEKIDGTELIKAAERGDISRVNELIAKGIDVNVKDRFSRTALLEASLYGHVETVKALLDKGADVNAKAKYGATALMVASLHGHVKIVKALIDKGADVNVRNIDGVTALRQASEKGHEEIIQLLKKAGAK